MITTRRFFLSLCSAAGFAITSQTGALAAAQLAPTSSQVQVYLLRGFGDVWSTGMDELAQTLTRQGYYAAVYSYKHGAAIARHLAQSYARGRKAILVLIGHSLGANVALQMADELDRFNVPIELVVTFDASKVYVVPDNVLHFVNFYQNNGIGKPATPAPGFKGELNNIDLTADAALNHFSLDDSARLHSYVMSKIAEVVQKDLAKVEASKPNKKPR
jgi:pimeloyl-ACP methyl ester carboxylesterase